MESKGVNQKKAAGVLIMVFLLGSVAGGLSVNLYQRMSGNTPKQNPPHDRGGKDHLFNRLNEKLSLSADQQTKVKQIVDDTMEGFEGIRKDIEPKVTVLRQAERDRIKAVLTQDQLPKYEEMVRDADARREKMKDEQEHHK